MKKLFSKLCALVVAITMVLGVGMTAFAEETPKTITGGTITVNNLDDKHTQLLEAYPIYYVDPTQEKGYRVVNESFQNWIDALSPSAKDITPEELTNLSAAATQTTAIDSVTSEVGYTTATFDKLPAGYYLILITETGTEKTTFVYTPIVESNYQFNENGKLEPKNVDAYVKGSANTFEKNTTDEDKVVQNGDIITYQIKAVVPYDAKEFYVTDNIKGAEYYFPSTSNNGAVFNVKLEKDESTTLGPFIPDVSGNPENDYEHTFTVNLKSILSNNTYAGRTIVITYTAKVTEATDIKNIAESSNFDKTQDVTIHTGIAQITKNGEGKKVLAGAKFALSKTDKDGNTVYAKFKKAANEDVYVTGEWTSEKPAANSPDQLVTTNEKGIAIIKGLNVGTYTFEEIVAPEGYSINTTDGSTVTISADKITKTQTTTMKDTKLNTLPSTGGMGTYIFTIVGVAVMVVAAAFFIYNGKAHK